MIDCAKAIGVVHTNGCSVLRFEGVDAFYGKKQVLFGVDLELADGRIAVGDALGV